jgi:hypothetical protein
MGDTDTLISFPANDTITLRTNGSERLRINSLGNIGMSNDMTGAGGVYARLTVQMPTQSGGSGIQVANSSNGSGDNGQALSIEHLITYLLFKEQKKFV